MTDLKYSGGGTVMLAIKRQVITDALGNPIGVILPISEFSLIEDVLTQRLRAEKDAQKLAQLELAAQDPLFLADLKESMEAFESADTDWWERD